MAARRSLLLTPATARASGDPRFDLVGAPRNAARRDPDRSRELTFGHELVDRASPDASGVLDLRQPQETLLIHCDPPSER
jgi:hypothetical protein